MRSLRRIAAQTLAFTLGLAVGWLMLRLTSVSIAPDQVAQRRALAVLDQPAAAPAIGNNQIVAAVKRIEPAVVNIDTAGMLRSPDDLDTVTSGATPREEHGKGSGVILTQDGYVVTNYHVIAGASRVRVTLPDSRWYYARLVGGDSSTDLAVLRIDATNLPVAELGDSDKLQVGEWSIAVGNPLGLGSTVTVGVISALNRRNLQIDDSRRLDDAIQTDAPINRGNSGGALANVNGQLMGITTAILSPGPAGGSIGLGFAIPVNTVRAVAREIIARGNKRAGKLRPWVGITYDAVSPETARALGLSPGEGVFIEHVITDSPAGTGGLEGGDILLAINGRSVRNVADVEADVVPHSLGDRLVMRVMRAGVGHPMDMPVTLLAQPERMPPAR